VSHGSIVLPATPEAVRAIVPLGLAAPEELTIMPLVMRVPPMPEIAQDLVGTVGLFVQLLYSGPESGAGRAIAPFRELGPVLQDSVAEMTYPDVYPPPSGTRWGIASEAMFIDRLDRETADIVIRRIGSASAGEAMVQLRVFGGAFARSPEDRPRSGTVAAALVWLLAVRGSRTGPSTPGPARSATSSPSRGTYLNFLESPDAAAMVAAYDPATLARLGSIKRAYDQDGLFGPAAHLGTATNE
jgi:hypothetical protein